MNPSPNRPGELSLDRRRFVQLAGATLALAGLEGCTKQPLEKIVPYVRQPEELVPGRPLFFATALAQRGYAAGVLAESHMGRPTKIEGNPEHPQSLGKTDLFAQAAVMDLYDPDRSRTVTQLGRIVGWNPLVAEIGKRLPALVALEGEGLRLLTGTVTSPTLGALIQELLARMPKARWHQWEAAGRDAVRRGALQAFGEAVEVRYDLTRADVVVALDADFLTSGPGAVRYAHDFASRRRVRTAEDQARGMSRLYSIESVPTNTSSVADHRLPLKPTEVGHFALALAARLGVAGAATPDAFAHGERTAWVEAVAEDLETHRGQGLVIAGDETDAEVHTLVHAINGALGNLGTTVVVTAPVEVAPTDQTASLRELVADLDAGKVSDLYVLGPNPVYDAPADVDFGAALDALNRRSDVKALSLHLGSHVDETALACQWHVPASHDLEAWSDARAIDGTATIGQPLVLPLYESHSPYEILAVLLGRPGVAGDELIREHWQGEWQSLGANGDLTGDFERFWRRSLHDGLVAGSTFPAKTVAVDEGAASAAAGAIAGWVPGELELAFRPDPTVLDGRYANNGWLQECPKPLTKLTWDNALLMSPATAEEHRLGDLLRGNDQWRNAPMARLQVGERTLDAAVWVVPGHPDGSVTLHLGYGRRAGGQRLAGAGFDANVLRTSATLWRVSEGVSFAATGEHYLLASTQDHHSMEGRDLVRRGDLDGDLKTIAEPPHEEPDGSLMDGADFPYDSYKWGMTIDLTACTACNACLIACQSENNIPTVGKDQVSRGREMHWIRIDRYYTSGDGNHVADVLNQPVYCMQCEQAPCEVVCPVGATSHSDEGLNDMVYNRCVGTRYCSNNCPYKVRRFNFLLYQDFETPSLQLGRNPDVTIRSRGVMEKCTYCVQRINQARIAAKKERRKIREGEIVTACQQVCPSDALVFGDWSDKTSAVSIAKASPLNYSLLGELGTRPRTTYLARLRNPNRKLEPRGTGEKNQHGHE